MKLNLKNKTVVVTGGSTGIGLAAALEFAREEANVVICGRNKDKLIEAKSLFDNETLLVEPFSGDVSKKADVLALANHAATLYGGIDVWFNNAGTSINMPMTEISDDDVEKLIDVNFKSAFWGCVTAAKYMKESGGGVILNTTSFAVKMPLCTGGIYAATKCAVDSLTKAFAAELAPYQIRVLSIVPGFIETPLTANAVSEYRKELSMSVAMGRLGKPEDLAKPIVFLASDAAGYISGVPIEISGAKYTVQDPWVAWIK